MHFLVRHSHDTVIIKTTFLLSQLERNQKLFSCFQDIMHQNCTGEIKMNKRTWY